MAFNITDSITTREGSVLSNYYTRIDFVFDRTGTSIKFVMYFFISKESYEAGHKTIRSNISFILDYEVNNDPYALYGLHLIAKNHMVTELGYTNIEITGIDLPPA